MQYRLDISGENGIVDVESANGAGTFVINDERKEVLFGRLPNGGLRLVVDGRAVTAHVAAVEGGAQVFVGGRVYDIEDLDKAASKKRRGGSDNGPNEVTPPMPAVVLRVGAAVGDVVEKGQGLVVVSAMKMETTLTAPYAGTVTAVNTEVDAKVMPGEILVDIEPAEGTEDDHE